MLKFECLDFLNEIDFRVLLLLITFEPLEPKNSCIALVKELIYGMNANGAKWYGCIFILFFSPLNVAVLLHHKQHSHCIVSTAVQTVGHRREV